MVSNSSFSDVGPKRLSDTMRRIYEKRLKFQSEENNRLICSKDLTSIKFTDFSRKKDQMLVVNKSNIDDPFAPPFLVLKHPILAKPIDPFLFFKNVLDSHVKRLICIKQKFKQMILLGSGTFATAYQVFYKKKSCFLVLKMIKYVNLCALKNLKIFFVGI